MVTPIREAATTVGFIDHYCQAYRSLFKDVRHNDKVLSIYIWECYRKLKENLCQKSLFAVGLKDSAECTAAC